MKIRISGFKILQGEDCEYDSESEMVLSRGTGSFGTDNPPFKTVEIEIDGNAYKFRSWDLIKAIQALE